MYDAGMLRLRWWLGLGLVASVAACGDSSQPSGGAAAGGQGAGGSGGTATVSGGGGEGGARCGDAGGELPANLLTMTWDDGVADTNLREQTFEITADNKTFVLNDEPLHEAVRFDLEHPARVYGFSIHWGALADDPTELLEAGLYGDFGHNGFDFWAPEPLFSGTRCAGDIDAEGWVDYVLDTPLEINHPGLVYVAHRAEPGAPVFSFDGSAAGDGTCALFADCHSALNLPEALPASYFNGLSFPFQYDYLVRLHYEYTEQVAASDLAFELQPGSPTGAHASFGDYDNDGDDDLLTEGPTLYRNDSGTFTNVTAEAGLASLGIYASGGVFGDYDNDGCLDVFAFAESYSAPDSLLHNECNGTFTDVTAASGIVDQQSYETCNDPANIRSPTAAAAWVDLDADGFLDLYLANFICWDKGTYYVDSVWHSLGDGTFEDWTASHGFLNVKRAGRGVNPVDVDADGDVDLMVNNYRLHANLFFQNEGNGTFDESALDLGVAGEASGLYYGHTIGTAFGDLDGDGDFDLISANLAHPRFFDFSDKTEVLLQGSDGSFSDAQGEFLTPASLTGLRYQETHSVPALADFDHDGDLDLVITAVYDGRPTDFYWGNGDGTFTLDAYRSGITTKNGWGVALADVDLDGDVDTFATQLFANQLDAAGHYLQVRVVGNVAANRAAIGATVRVLAAGQTFVRYVQGGTGQGNQDSMYLHFGLGDSSQVDSVSVVFPGGAEVTYSGPFDADQRLWLYEDGSAGVGLTGNP